jgi:uncharacterized protein YbjT (DUF2867 family)
MRQTRSHRVLLLGGSGFIGSAVAEALTKARHSVTVPTRDRERAKHLLLLPTCDVVAANVFEAATLDRLIASHDVVINLIGILRGDFERVHVAFPTLVAERCAALGVTRLIHMSALAADANGPSNYLRSRGRGEAAVWNAARNKELQTTMFRPSVVFGEGDNFINMLKRLVRLFPVIPLGSSNARFQVVWVEDVARAIVQSIDMQDAHGKTYELVGPKVYTMRELLDFVMAQIGVSRLVIPLPHALAMLQAIAFEFPPGRWFGSILGVTLGRDNVRSMQVENVSKEGFPSVFGTPATMEAVVASYFNLPAGRSRYNTLRQRMPD